MKAELLDTLISSGESPAPPGKTPETGAIPCVVVLCSPNLRRMERYLVKIFKEMSGAPKSRSDV